MKPERNSQSQTKMQAVAVLFDQWRSTRKNKDPIPESLWEAAADLSQSYSTCQISKELRLDFNKLKHRIRARSHRTALRCTPESSVTSLKFHDMSARHAEPAWRMESAIVLYPSIYGVSH